MMLLFCIKKERKISHMRKDQNPISLILIFLPPNIERRKTIELNKIISRLHVLMENPDNLRFRNVSNEAVRKMIKRQ
jgi:hypothetical protein